MGHAWQDYPIEILQKCFESFAFARRFGRKRLPNLSRFRPRQNWKGLNAFVIVGDPVHHRVSVFAKLLWSHMVRCL